MEIVPLRALLLLVAAAMNATEPLPVPLVPAVTVSHVALLTAVHAHEPPAVTVTEPLPPAAGTDWLVGEIEDEHAAASVTVNVLPAMVMDPVCAPVVVLAAALKATVP